MSGRLVHPQCQIIANLLINNGQGTLPTTNEAWPVYYSSEPDTPDNCITVYDTEGRDFGRAFGKRFFQEGFQVKIRGKDYNTGFNKANALAIYLDNSVDWESVTIEGSQYTIPTIVRTGGVLSLGKEVGGKKQRNLFTLNAVVSH